MEGVSRLQRKMAVFDVLKTTFETPFRNGKKISLYLISNQLTSRKSLGFFGQHPCLLLASGSPQSIGVASRPHSCPFREPTRSGAWSAVTRVSNFYSGAFE